MFKFVLPLGIAAAAEGAEWDYKTNGADWPSLSPDCGKTNQSPIDLPDPWTNKNFDIPMYENAEFNFKRSYSNVENVQVNWNGHTVQTNLPDG